MTIQQIQFLKYVRTKMVFSLRLRTGSDELKPVSIKAEEIEKRFFGFNRKAEIKALINAGELKVTQSGGKAFYYEALKPGAFDLSLLIAKPIPTDTVTRTMLQHLKNVSLPREAESTDYFNLFLKYKDSRADLFFKVDSFSGRVHTPVSSFKKKLRSKVLLDGEETINIDVNTMQPLILGKVLLSAIGQNEFSTWINSGIDIYVKLQKELNLENRDKAKEYYYRIMYSKPTDKLITVFGSAKWIKWLAAYKSVAEPRNPHGKKKPWSNLSWLLQTIEVEIMRKVWKGLTVANIPFLTVHDEIIIPLIDAAEAESIMHKVLSKEFKFYKVSTKNEVLLSATLPTFTTLKPLVAEETQLNEISDNEIQKNLKPRLADEIEELEAFLKTANLPTGEIRFNNCSTILNVQAFNR